MTKTYIQRIVDTAVERRLESVGAIVIEGPRGCGKTTTGAHHSATVTQVDSPGSLAAASIDPRLLLGGNVPVLLDEWQAAPSVWNAVRREIDDRQAVGQFILTGSARPLDDPTRHSGVGRFGRVVMRTMSLSESGLSNGTVKLADLFAGEPVAGRSAVGFEGYVEAIVRGGWPALIDASLDSAREFNRDYVELLATDEVASLDRSHRDPRRLRALLEAFAAFSAHPAPMSRVISRSVTPDDSVISRVTGDLYATALERLMVIDDVPAWSTHLRSRARLTEYPKRHLTDPALACALLRATPDSLISDLNTLGYLFESLVTRDLRVYADANDADVFHYRERGGELEVDLIVEQRGGAWIGVEVKMGIGHVDEAAATLLRLANTRVTRPPSALIVVTTSEYAYTRPDGVSVVPLGTLTP